jgi:hypothetical protein
LLLLHLSINLLLTHHVHNHVLLYGLLMLKILQQKKLLLLTLLNLVDGFDAESSLGMIFLVLRARRITDHDTSVVVLVQWAVHRLSFGRVSPITFGCSKVY